MSSTGNNGSEPNSKKTIYDCTKCPAYCCSYDRICVTNADIARLGIHFAVSFKDAERRYTKISLGSRVLRQQKDNIYKRGCLFLNLVTRRCAIYDARPAVCRNYPETRNCGYYTFLSAERRRQSDPEFIPSA